MSPSQVKSVRDVIQLNASAWDGRGYWMLVSHDGSVSIHQQRAGEALTQEIKIPRRTFAAMVDWYLREQP